MGSEVSIPRVEPRGPSMKARKLCYFGINMALEELNFILCSERNCKQYIEYSLSAHFVEFKPMTKIADCCSEYLHR